MADTEIVSPPTNLLTIPDLAPLWKAVAAVGVPAVIALYLVWTLANFVVTSERTMLAQMNEISRVVEMIQADRAADRVQVESLKRVIRVLCVNSSETRKDREACLAE